MRILRNSSSAAADPGGMGFTYVSAEVSNPANLTRWEPLTLLVDTGALLCLVPASLLEELGVAVQRRRRFCLADGSVVERRVGMMALRLEGEVTGTDVIFGEPGDTPLLGVTALEQIGLVPDPLSGTLKRVDLLLVGMRLAS